MRMPISRTHFRLSLALVIIVVFAVLLRTRIVPDPVVQPAFVEVVNRGLKPEDEAKFRETLTGLLAQKATSDASGTSDVSILLRIGVQHYILGEVALAADAYRAILTTHPSDAPALENLGQALYEMGDYVGALEAWQRAVDVSPTDTTYIRIVDLINEKLPEHKLRIPAVLEHGIANLGQTYGFLIRLGDWYAEAGDYVRAVSHYEVALQLSNNKETEKILEVYRQKLREQEAASLRVGN